MMTSNYNNETPQNKKKSKKVGNDIQICNNLYNKYQQHKKTDGETGGPKKTRNQATHKKIKRENEVV